MSILKRLRDKREGNVATVKYMIEGEEVTFGEDGNVVNALVRKAMKGQAKRMLRKYGHLVHPETGERPEILIIVPDAKKPAMECRLVTDSEVLRAWIKEKGIAVSEIVVDKAE